MHGTRPGRCNAGANLAGEFSVTAGHERRHFFVASLHELNAFGCTRQRTHDAVDAVARITEDAAHAPIGQSCYKEISDGCGHVMDHLLAADLRTRCQQEAGSATRVNPRKGPVPQRWRPML